MLLEYLGANAFPHRSVAWGRMTLRGRGAQPGGDREAFGWPSGRALPEGVALTPRIEAPGVLRNVPLAGPVGRADLHLIPTDDGVWCVAVEVTEEEGEQRGPAREDRELEKQDILLHTIVHDLASPLSGIVGCLTSIEDGVGPEDLTRLVTLALRQAHRQERLIQQILDVFRADDDDPDEEEAQPSPDIGLIARGLVEHLEPSFALRGVRLSVDDRTTELEGRPHLVIGEETRLERVLANLLDNGLRHAPTGSVVTVRLEGDERRVELSVLDEGPGVPPDQIEGLFARLSQGENRGRVGLGLYFCRITIQRWGGQVGYAPLEGGGARFWFRLPWVLEEPREESLRAPTIA